MKKQVFILVIIGLFALSCKKNVDNNYDPSVIDTTHHDSIQLFRTVYYKHYLPDTSITMHTIVQVYLDIDNDSVAELRFHLWSWEIFIAPDVHTGYTMGIDGLDSLQFKVINDQYHMCDTPLDSGVSISRNDNFRKNFTLYQYYPGMGTSNCGYKKKFVGFVLPKNGKTYLGWIRLQSKDDPFRIIIDEFATLTSVSDSIKAGQH